MVGESKEDNKIVISSYWTAPIEKVFVDLIILLCRPAPSRRRRVTLGRRLDMVVANRLARALLPFALLAAHSVAAAQGWGSIQGRVVWGAPELPKPAPLDVVKDKEHCLQKGPLVDEIFVVDASSRGLKNVVVYLRFRDKAVIHPDLPQSAKEVEARFKAEFAKANGFAFDELKAKHAAKAVKLADVKTPIAIDQLHCTYVPHVLAVREGQPLLVLNKEPIAHNVKVSSLSGRNDANPILPPDSFEIFNWKEEKGVLNVECSIHGWMRMHAMVFDHPYYSVTDEQGKFTIDKAPAGHFELVVRLPPTAYIDPLKGGKGTARGAKITVLADKQLDLGEIKFAP